MRILGTLLLAFSLLPLSSYAADIEEYRLKNGMQLIVKPDHRAPVVTSMVWYHVGSSYEPNGITGVSHVLEHMMFQGTKSYGAGEFSKLIAENGGKENAFTGQDYTAYYQSVTNDKLALIFRLEADRMQYLTLKQTDFEKELQVVIEERRLRTEDNPFALVYERFSAAAFLSNPYHQPVIGWMNDLNNMTLDDVKYWYNRWYSPNNATLVVVGDVEPSQVLLLAKHYFADIPARELPAVKAHKDVPAIGARFVTVKAPAKLPLIIVGYNVPVVHSDNDSDDPYALVVLSSILGKGDSARLEKNLVRAQHIASGIDVNYDPFSRLSSVFTINGIPAQGYEIIDLQKAIDAQITLLQNRLVTVSELERVKVQLIADKIYAQDSLMYQGIEIGILETIGLSWKDIDIFIEKIKQVTPSQVQAVAKKYLIDDRRTTAILEPLVIQNNNTNKGADDVQ